MIVLDVQQGTPEWHYARLGIPTASQFEAIVKSISTPKQAGAHTYAEELISEMLMGEHEAGYDGGWVGRGKELEDQAAAEYAFQNDAVLKKVGFCLDDSRRMGASPDSLVVDSAGTYIGGLEIKCPSAKIHAGYLVNNSVAKDYWGQVQGNLLVTGLPWWDVMSFHPKMPSSIIRVEPDLSYFATLRASLAEFNRMVALKRQILVNRGYKLQGSF